MNSTPPILSPHELRALPLERIPYVCDQLRAFLIREITLHGGHFAAGLGAVELTVALHYVFNTPHDLLVWDVGHQCYPHKIICERGRSISTVRKKSGLAPFPSRSESEYDVFGVGHAGTSISAALGMVLGVALSGEKQTQRHVTAIIGDGGMNAGMAFEGLNHLGALDVDLLVILNDNAMSISPNVGALHNYFARLVSSQPVETLLHSTSEALSPMPSLHKVALKTKRLLQDVVSPGRFSQDGTSSGRFFEELGMKYFGPINGHNSISLIHVLRNINKIKGARLLHLITRKGKGYKQAEDNPVKFHAVSGNPQKNPFSPSPLSPKHPKTSAMDVSLPFPCTSYSKVFGKWLCDMAKKDAKLTAITPAMCEGSGMAEFAKLYPQRFFDVGIAEQHSVTLAAGMACADLKPVVAIYSTFLQRAYDQLIHDVALQNLKVTFAIDRAGVVGPDGPTHGGIFDLTFLRCVPNMIVMLPSDENMARKMLSTAYLHPGPAAVRYPRGKGPGSQITESLDTIPIGKSKIVCKGKNIALLSFGTLLSTCLSVAATLKATVVDMRFVKPLDKETIDNLCYTHKFLVTLEDNVVAGGAGSAVNEYLLSQGSSCAILNLGLPDRFQEHASREELLEDASLSARDILSNINTFVAKATTQGGRGGKNN